MTDDEARIKAAFGRLALPEPPERLHRRLADIAAAQATGARAWRLWASASVIAVGAALLLLWLAVLGPGATPSPSPSATPGGLARYDTGMFSFSYPAPWRTFDYHVDSSFSHTLVYLATVDVPEPCETIPASYYTTVDCEDRWTLGRDDVVVVVSAEGRPGFDITNVPRGAGTLTVDGQPGYSEKGIAPSGDPTWTWTFARPGAPDNYFTIRATFRGPDAGMISAELFALVASIRFDTSATPSPSAGSSPRVSSIAWAAIGPPLGSCVVTTAMSRRSGDLLAICQDVNLQPQVLASTDGRNWVVSTPVGIAPTTPGDVIVLRGVAENPSGDLLLVGAEASGDMSSGDAAAWTSSDAIHWRRVDPTPVFQDAEILGVIATADGYLAVGDDGFPGGNVQLPSLRQAAIWQASADGRQWVRLPAPPDAAHRELEGLVAGREGYVAWGDGAPPGSGAMWSSADGRSWQPVVAPTGGWGPLARVIWSGAGYVAVGTSQAGDSSAAGIWTSSGGATWTPRTGSGSLGPLWDVAISDVMVAAGDGVTAESEDGGTTWTMSSPDSSLGGGTVRHLVSTADGDTVAFGTISGATADQGHIWFAQAGVPSACRTTDLSIMVTNTGAAAGNVGGYLRFANTSPSACSLQGPPRLTAVTADGTPTQARILATVGTPFPNLAEPPLVVLQPGDAAFAAFGGSDHIGGDATCPPPYHTFHVAPPGDTSTVELSAFNTWLGQDQPSCVGIAVTVIAPAGEVEQYTDLSSLRP